MVLITDLICFVGVNIVVVAISDQLNEENLKKFSDNKENNIFKMSSFDQFKTQLKAIVKSICEGN